MASTGRPRCDQEGNGVGEVILALRVVVAHVLEDLEEERRLEAVDPGVNLFDGQLLGRGVLGLHDSTHAAAVVADDTAQGAGILAHRGEQRGRGSRFGMAGDQLRDVLAAEERNIGVGNDDRTGVIREGLLGLHDRVSGTQLLFLNHVLDMVADGGLNILGAVTHYDYRAGYASPSHRVNNSGRHGTTAHLHDGFGGGLRLHTCSLAGGKDNPRKFP